MRRLSVEIPYRSSPPASPRYTPQVRACCKSRVSDQRTRHQLKNKLPLSLKAFTPNQARHVDIPRPMSLELLAAISGGKRWIPQTRLDWTRVERNLRSELRSYEHPLGVPQRVAKLHEAIRPDRSEIYQNDSTIVKA